MRRRRREHADFQIVKEGIKNLFKDLRRKGFVARLNFTCCGSCGAYEGRSIALAQEKTKLVFYHRQGEDYLKSTGRVHLHYHPIVKDDETITDPVLDQTCKQVGDEIVALIANHPTITYEWKGTADDCILIKRAQQ